MSGVLLFEIIVILYTIGLFTYMVKKKYSNVLRKFCILFVGVLLFEIMSEPMWLNDGFSSWAYIYQDITWVLTLGWVSIFMTAIILIDRSYGSLSEHKRFWYYLLCIEAITVPIEMGLLQTGVRDYAPLLKQSMSGLLIPFTIVPIEAVYAIPLFAALIISFYKYINHLFEVKKHG